MRSQIISEREATLIDKALLAEDNIYWDFVDDSQERIGFFEEINGNTCKLIAEILLVIDNRYKFISW